MESIVYQNPTFDVHDHVRNSQIYDELISRSLNFLVPVMNRLIIDIPSNSK